MNKKITKNIDSNKLKDILNTRGFLGYKIGKNLGIRGSHPSMTNYILGHRKNLTVIDVRFSLKNIIKTLYILLSIILHDGHILIVNTNPENLNPVYHFITKTKNFGNYFSYCNSKWVGGTLTNWDQITNSIATFISFSQRFGLFIAQHNIHFPRYKKLKKSFQGFTFSYQEDTKKKDPKGMVNGVDRMVSQRIRSFGGIDRVKNRFNLKKPDLLLVINPNDNINLLYEAKKLNIPVIAFTDTNSDLSLINYPIPVNNKNPFFIQYYFSWIIRILNRNKKLK